MAKVAADANAAFGTVSGVAARADFGANSQLDKEATLRMLRVYDTNASYLIPDLERDLPELHKEAKQSFINTMLGSPDFTNALFTHYTPG